VTPEAFQPGQYASTITVHYAAKTLSRPWRRRPTTVAVDSDSQVPISASRTIGCCGQADSVSSNSIDVTPATS